MASKRLTMRAMAGLTLWASFGLSAQAQLPAVTVESACKIMPVQPGVLISTPSAEQMPQCRVDPIPNPQNPKSLMGYVVRDAAGKSVRQFVSSDGKNYNVRAFYLDGVEAYREFYPANANQPYQFRWLGPNGSKWGLDRDRDGRIDDWVAISPEEVSQELLQAVLTRDAKRAEALAISKANLDALGYKGAESQQLLARASNIGKRVIEAADALKAGPDAKWVHLQLASPQTTPADAFGAIDDLVTYKSGTIILQEQSGKTPKSLQTGDMIQIGRAWKLVDGPGGTAADLGQPGNPIPPEIEPLLQKLSELDQVNPATLADPAVLAAYNAKRSEILEQIVAKLPADKQEQWLRLLIEALSAAAEGEKLDGKHITKLRQVKDSLAKGPNASLAAHAVYRYLGAENNINISTTPPDGFSQLQDKWRAALEEFAKTYPNSDEAPEAILRLAMASEYQKDGEGKAKEWYGVLAQRYSKHPHAIKAIGAIKRVESEGKPLELVGTILENGQQFNVASLQGKVVVVYYCASWSRSLPDDAKKLDALAKQYGPKGLQVVTVCLDNDARTAGEAIAKYGIPGTHLFAPGGLDASPLAAAYGIQVIPHVFVAKDGKVVNRNAQIASLEEDLKRLLP